MPPIRVAIVDDHPFIIEALQNYFKQHADIEVGGTASTAHTGFSLISNIGPSVDIAIVDIHLPCNQPIRPHLTAGVWLSAQLHSRLPRLKFLAYTGERKPIYREAALRAGVHSFLSKDAPTKNLADIIRQVCQGRHWPENMPPTPFSSLSIRELQIVHSIGEGFTDRKIAEELGISENTVKYHIRSIYNKLGITSRNDAIALVQDQASYLDMVSDAPPADVHYFPQSLLGLH